MKVQQQSVLLSEHIHAGSLICRIKCMYVQENRAISLYHHIVSSPILFHILLNPPCQPALYPTNGTGTQCITPCALRSPLKQLIAARSLLPPVSCLTPPPAAPAPAVTPVGFAGAGTGALALSVLPNAFAALLLGAALPKPHPCLS